MKESHVATYLKAAIKRAGGLIYKIVFEGQADCPDYIAFINGKILLIETKAPGENPRPSQQYLFTLIQKHAAAVEVVHNRTEVDNIINRTTGENNDSRI